mgnify:CR=1 FL=1
MEFGAQDAHAQRAIGRNAAVARINSLKFSGFAAWLVWLAVHIFWLIGFRNRLLVMTRTLDADGEDVERLPMRVHRLALVRGLINRDNPAPFVIDRGGQVISISRSTATALQLRPPRHIPLKVYGVSGLDPDAFLMPGLDLTFDNVQLKNTSVAVLNLDAPSALLGLDLGGIMGHKFLSRYRVAIDLPRGEMRLR